ncbi:hypothetical protein AVEN_81486-1 [Araneus ventricosus]|uniref:Uncharacterized protein n=1 Tax=Araneus ventricosus TaxID=182803 RepID=A0A4Y2E189_ARAVE|nr:hypothetical protein AVEN_81486-1 [Araneus ventricosus]
MRIKKQTERLKLLMEISLTYRKGMEGISKKQRAKRRVDMKEVKILGPSGLGRLYSPKKGFIPKDLSYNKPVYKPDLRWIKFRTTTLRYD